MKKRNNLRTKILAIGLVAGLAIALGIKGHLDNPRYTTKFKATENIPINSKVVMCFTKYSQNEEDRRLCVFGGYNRIINSEGDTLPFYTYYSGPVPQELCSITSSDSLETIVNESVTIKGVVMTNKIITDTTLKTRLKYKPIISKVIIDATKARKRLIEFEEDYSSIK